MRGRPRRWRCDGLVSERSGHDALGGGLGSRRLVDPKRRGTRRPEPWCSDSQRIHWTRLSGCMTLAPMHGDELGPRLRRELGNQDDPRRRQLRDRALLRTRDNLWRGRTHPDQAHQRGPSEYLHREARPGWRPAAEPQAGVAPVIAAPQDAEDARAGCFDQLSHAAGEAGRSSCPRAPARSSGSDDRSAGAPCSRARRMHDVAASVGGAPMPASPAWGSLPRPPLIL